MTLKKETRDGLFGNYFSKNGDASVDWDYYFMKKKDYPDEAEQFLHYLLEIGYLAVSLKDNWLVVSSENINLNPRTGIIKLFFRSDKEACAYARAQGYFGVIACHIDKIVEI